MTFYYIFNYFYAAAGANKITINQYKCVYTRFRERKILGRQVDRKMYGYYNKKEKKKITCIFFFHGKLPNKEP